MKAIDVNDALSMRRISLMIHVSQLRGDVVTAKNIGGSKRYSMAAINTKGFKLVKRYIYTQQFNYNNNYIVI